MAFAPADNLNNRSFVSLIVSQFLASFNDQAIHAAAMFYAIHQGVLTEQWAITILPILFFLPWAIFCTASAYFADRFSKTASIRAWKFAEIPIALLLIFGFWLGDRSTGALSITIGTWCVLAGVFLMGTHAAFFSPAKYGAMPEILQAHVLSRGNGILESSTFLANIFGTVAGGMLSFLLFQREIWIGVILLILAIVGAVFSLLMDWLPASDPKKKFSPFGPLVNGFRDVFGSRPLMLGVMGIAFFVFMATYMRSTLYLHGQTRVPPWDEFHTSLVVATVALGVGLGSPLAGWLSGGKIELGLVPIGCVGMIVGAVVAATMLQHDAALIAALILLGFFSGFYMVPLYAILQHRAPKKSKGEIIAVSNFVNVVGAMTAPLLFFVLGHLGDATGMTPVIEQNENRYVGTVAKAEYDPHRHIEVIRLRTVNGIETIHKDAKSVIRLPKGGIDEGMEIAVASAHLREIDYYWVRPAAEPNRVRHNHETLPRYLFLAAAAMAVGVLIALWRMLPDFLVRSVFGFTMLGKCRLKAVGMSNLPTQGPVLLATNCDRLEASLQVVSATDRDTLVVLVESANLPKDTSWMRSLALGTDVVVVRAEAMPTVPDPWTQARPRAQRELAGGNLLAVNVDVASERIHVEKFLNELRDGREFPVLPVWCGPLPTGDGKQIRVVFGEAVPCQSIDVAHLRQKIDDLRVWIRDHDGTTAAGH